MTQVKIEIEGLGQLMGQLIALGEAADDVIEGAIFDLANETRNLAVAGISGGGKSGRVYEKYQPRRTHQASAAGQYPATDTGRLVASVKALINGSTAIVGTNMEYGPWLEFGTSKMAARPWLLPSFEKAKIGLERGLKAAIEARTK